MSSIVLCRSKNEQELNCFRNLRDDFLDATIHTKDKTFKVHRIVMAANSEYFETMFKAKFRESNGIVEMKEMNSTLFECILEFVYTGTCTVASAQLCDFLRCVHLCAFKELQHVIENFMLNNLNESQKRDNMSVLSIIDALILADTFGLSELENAAIFYICKDMKGLRKAVLHDETCISKITHHQIKKILCDAENLECSESALFKIAKAWICNQSSSLDANKEAEILAQIRFAFIPKCKRQKVFADPIMHNHQTLLTNSVINAYDGIGVKRRGMEFDIRKASVGDAVTVISDFQALKIAFRGYGWSDSINDMIGGTYKITYIDVAANCVRLSEGVNNRPATYTYNFPCRVLTSHKSVENNQSHDCD